MNAVFLAACAVLFVVPLVFVAHSVYQDGLVGRLGLIGVAAAAACFLLAWYDGSPVEVHPLVVVMAASFAWFLSWHLGKFELRCLKQSEWSLLRWAARGWLWVRYLTSRRPPEGVD